MALRPAGTRTPAKPFLLDVYGDRWAAPLLMPTVPCVDSFGFNMAFGFLLLMAWMLLSALEVPLSQAGTGYRTLWSRLKFNLEKGLALFQ